MQNQNPVAQTYHEFLQNPGQYAKDTETQCFMNMLKSALTELDDNRPRQLPKMIRDLDCCGFFSMSWEMGRVLGNTFGAGPLASGMHCLSMTMMRSVAGSLFDGMKADSKLGRFESLRTSPQNTEALQQLLDACTGVLEDGYYRSPVHVRELADFLRAKNIEPSERYRSSLTAVGLRG